MAARESIRATLLSFGLLVGGLTVAEDATYAWDQINLASKGPTELYELIGTDFISRRIAEEKQALVASELLLFGTSAAVGSLFVSRGLARRDETLFAAMPRGARYRRPTTPPNSPKPSRYH